jgi:hypothetical protein
VKFSANFDGSPSNIPLSLAGQSVTAVRQSAAPGAPELHVAVSGDRAVLSWDVTVGAGMLNFVVRGALRGSSLTDVITLAGGARAWTTPALSPGSYEVEVAASNWAGTGPASNRVAFSVGVPALPEAPTDVTATVVDDRVEVRWRPASTGPAASRFAVEGAPAGSAAFAEVARSDGSPFVAMRAPIGSWALRIRAVTAGGTGPPSAPVTVTTTRCSAPPAAPRQPWVLTTYPWMTLRWSLPSAGSVERYIVEVGSALGRSDLGRLTVAGDRVSLTAPFVTERVFVRLRAVNACGESPASPDVVAP